MTREIVDPSRTREAIRKHQEGVDWEYKDEAARLYALAQEMDRRFFNGLVYPDGTKVPTPVIAFDDLRNNNTLACYDLFPDEIGIMGKITFNTYWYENKEWKLGNYSQGETLLHEYVHLWQQIGRGKDPFKQKKHGRNTHNKEFVDKCEALGIHPAPVTGVHQRIATVGSPIDILLKEFGIYPDPKAYEKTDGKMSWADWLVFGGEKPKGKSTLHKWVCVTCGTSVNYGRKDDPELVHKPCNTTLIRAERGVIYGK